MISPNEISKVDCAIIAKKIREDIFKPAFTFKTTIFLCGADISQKTTTRYKISQALTSSFEYSMYYDLIYPEDIFDELLYSSHSPDLLSLENLLADSVDAVIMIPESPGSYTELGAFASNEKLRTKLVCVIDEKYRKAKSFINKGPLRLVKEVNKTNIVYVNLDEIGKNIVSGIKSFSFLSRDPEIDKIVSALRKLKKTSSKDENKVTLLQLDKFLLPAIYLLEPVSKSTLIEIVASTIEDTKYSTSSTITALTMLSKKRYVELIDESYKLTELGTNEFLSFRKKNSRYKEQDKTIAIDNLRLEILNLKIRKKKLKV
jgi:hypothetical protein